MTLLLLILLAQDAQALHPAQAWLEKRLEVRALMREDKEKAYHLAEELLQSQPGSPRAHIYVAYLAMETGRQERTFEVLKNFTAAGMIFNDRTFSILENAPAYTAIDEQLKKNRQQQCRADLAFKGDIKSFFAEGIAHDARDGSFFLGSIHLRRIVKRNSDGQFEDFVSSGRDGLMSVLGMVLDEKRNLLWAASSGLDQSKDLPSELLGRSGLFAFNPKTGELVHKIMLEGTEHNLGDMALATDGTLYATDTAGQAVYRLKPGATHLEQVIQSPWLRSPQGLCLSADEKHLYVADYTFGLFKIDLSSKKIRQLTTKKTMLLAGIDGLKRHGNRLIAIQNGTNPHRVVAWDLNKAGDRLVKETVLCQNLEAFDEPTLGTLVGDQFYFVANSQWGRYTKDHRPIKDDLAVVHIYKIQL